MISRSRSSRSPTRWRALGEAYEQLDDQHADVLEEQLFRPVQSAYGRAQRTYSEFASRSQLRARTFSVHSPGAQSQTVRELIERAGDAAYDADQSIAELQDSMLPVEVGRSRAARRPLAGPRDAVGGAGPRPRARAHGRSLAARPPTRSSRLPAHEEEDLAAGRRGGARYERALRGGRTGQGRRAGGPRQRPAGLCRRSQAPRHGVAAEQARPCRRHPEGRRAGRHRVPQRHARPRLPPACRAPGDPPRSP